MRYDWYGWLSTSSIARPTDLFTAPYSFFDSTFRWRVNPNVYEEWTTSDSLDWGRVGLVPLNADGTVVQDLPLPTVTGTPHFDWHTTVPPIKRGTPYVLANYRNTRLSFGPDFFLNVPISDPEWQFIQPIDTDGGSVLFITVAGSTNIFDAGADMPFFDVSLCPDLHVMSSWTGPLSGIFPYNYAFNPCYLVGWIKIPPHNTDILRIYLRNSLGTDVAVEDFVSVLVWAIDLEPNQSFTGPTLENIDRDIPNYADTIYISGLNTSSLIEDTVHGLIDHTSLVEGPEFSMPGFSWFPGATGGQFLPFCTTFGGGAGIWERQGDHWVCVPIQPRVAGEWVDPSGLHMMQGGKWVDVGCTPGDVHS
jgi:hypothetical protein